MKNNLKFLDIDGVLNSEHFYEYTENHTWEMLDPSSVHLLNRLAKDNAAGIVITSDWRRTYGMKVIKRVFKKNEVKIEIIGETVKCIGMNRGVLIQTWLDSHKNINNYVILDDVDTMLDSQKKNFVQTSPIFGLCFADWYKADEILKK